MNEFMQEAINEAKKGIKHKHGGPFGCVIVKNGKIVGKGHNKVLKNHDATCHGEIMAIRDASKKLGTYDLSSCQLYTTGEPCPMCLFACMWANISTIYYGATIKDNALIGFRDEKFNNLLVDKSNFEMNLIQIDHEECIDLFQQYLALNPTKY